MQVLYASPPHEASTATSFSDFRPAHAQASLWLFSLFFLASCLIFLQLCQSPLRLFRRPLSIVRPFFVLPPRQAFNAPSIVRFRFARDRLLFPCISVVYLLVISPFSIGLLLGVMIGPNFWVVEANFILSFWSMRISVGMTFVSL
jgi:hypothetical protein